MREYARNQPDVERAGRGETDQEATRDYEYRISIGCSSGCDELEVAAGRLRKGPE
jgi:hypothetical protein